jgi:protein-S-isoprenylcysteine O-methyltransferase Ste14
MEIFPDLELGLFNGWLLAAIFYLIFGVLLVLLPKRVVARLYDRSGRRDSGVVRRVLGLLLFLAWLLLVILTPLRNGALVLPVGLAFYACGLMGFMVALFNYANSPADQPVTAGLYRTSRHPQQFMISVSFLGISIAIGSWIALILIGIGIVAAHNKVLAEEEACLQMYGESYRDYMERVPRYFLLF